MYTAMHLTAAEKQTGEGCRCLTKMNAGCTNILREMYPNMMHSTCLQEMNDLQVFLDSAIPEEQLPPPSLWALESSFVIITDSFTCVFLGVIHPLGLGKSFICLELQLNLTMMLLPLLEIWAPTAYESFCWTLLILLPWVFQYWCRAEIERMSVKDLRSYLASKQISTTGFLEKSDFVNAARNTLQ